jgi:hypothetical protein
MNAKLKPGSFRIGNNRPFSTPKQGRTVIITDKENHPLWGERYKIEDSHEWYEKSCFEWIEGE